MQNNTTKIIAAIIAILALGGIATLAMSGNKPADQMVKNTISQTSDVMKKTEDATKIAADKMLMEKETMMKKDAMSKSSEVMTKTSDAMSKSSDSMINKDEMMKKEGDAMSKDMMNKTAELSSPTGMYSQYSVNNLAQNSVGTNIIFFHAPWCPSCKSVDAEINANLNKLPENFQILKADFDTSTALKQKYGVTSQSTFVKVDKDGNKVGSVSPQFSLKTVDDIVAFGNK